MLEIRLIDLASVMMLSVSVTDEPNELFEPLASSLLNSGRGGCISASSARRLAVSLLGWMLRRLRVLCLPFTLREERLAVDRRRASLSETGMTTPSALRDRRENRGAEALVIQFSSGFRDVLGSWDCDNIDCRRADVLADSEVEVGDVDGLREGFWDLECFPSEEGGLARFSEPRAHSGSSGTGGASCIP